MTTPHWGENPPDGTVTNIAVHNIRGLGASHVFETSPPCGLLGALCLHHPDIVLSPPQVFPSQESQSWEWVNMAGVPPV